MPNRGDAPRVARLTGIPAQTLLNWRKGAGEPNVSDALAICRALDITLDWLAGNDPIPDQPIHSSHENVNPGKVRHAINEDVLVEAMSIVERVLSREKKIISIDAHARVIAAVYDEILIENRVSSDVSVHRYLRLVSG